MLHPRVRHLDQLVAVFVPGIRPEPVLETLEHRPGLRELTPGGVHVIVERPEVEREGTALTLERSEEHTSELQSLAYLVCRLLLEKKKKKKKNIKTYNT